MQLIDRILQRNTAAAPAAAPAAAVQKPGRHSEAGLVERLRAEVVELTAQRDEARGRSDFHMRGWKAADAEVKRLRVLLGRDAMVPARQMPAPADEPGFEPLPDAPTPDREKDQLSPIALSLPRPETYEVADVTAETQPVPVLDVEATQPVDVSTLRDALGEGDTVTLPVVSPVTPVPPVDDTQMLVTWGTKIPDAGPTEVPVGLGQRVSVKVATALDEAS